MLRTIHKTTKCEKNTKNKINAKKYYKYVYVRSCELIKQLKK